MTTPTKKFHANYMMTITTVIGFALLFLLGAIEDPTLEFPPYAYLVVIFGTLFAYATERYTYLTISDTELVSFGETFLPRKVLLTHIKEVRRVQRNPIFHDFGSNISLYGNDGFIMTIREANYSAATLREFLTELQKRTPSATYDPQYEELINKDTAETAGFKSRPGTHSSY